MRAPEPVPARSSGKLGDMRREMKPTRRSRFDKTLLKTSFEVLVIYLSNFLESKPVEIATFSL